MLLFAGHRPAIETKTPQRMIELLMPMMPKVRSNMNVTADADYFILDFTNSTGNPELYFKVTGLKERDVNKMLEILITWYSKGKLSHRRCMNKCAEDFPTA